MRALLAVISIFIIFGSVSLCAGSELKSNYSSKAKFTSAKNARKVKNEQSVKIEKLILSEDALAELFKTDVRQDQNFLSALERSIEYFESIQDKTTDFKYGDETYSSQEMLQSMQLFKSLVMQDISYGYFLSEITRLFDMYAVNNYQSKSIFTGYFTPRLDARLTQEYGYQTPLHLKDGSKVFVQSLSQAKSAIMEGASVLNLNNGDTKVITYSKTEYIPISVKTQKVVKTKAKKRTIYVTKTVQKPRTIFEETTDPMGCLATPLTPGYSAAMDARFTPMGSLIYVYNEKENGEKPFERFMLVQDVGGAIRGPGRIDVYLGEGNSAKQDTFTLARNGSVLMIIAKKEALAVDNHIASLHLQRGENE